MKMTCPQSIKFLKLKRRLRLPHWQVVGLLESLWLFTQMNAPRGDIGRLSNEDLAATIEWDGDADQLVLTLVECGFLDECEANRLVVHDWADHVPTYLKGALSKNNIEFAKHVAKQPAKHCAKHGAEQLAKQTQNDAEQPAPSLVLSGVGLSGVANPINTPPNPQGGTAVVSGNGEHRKPRTPKDELPYSEDFETFWRSFSPVRKGNKPDAWKAWRDAVKSTDPQEIIQAAIDFSLSPVGLGEYCPGPAPWLRGKRWQDDRASWQGAKRLAEQLTPKGPSY